MKTAITTPLIIFSLICFAFFPKLQAVVPPPDGGYPNFTTAEGTNALRNLTTGSANTAVGWFSLFSNTDGGFNTATGAGTLLFNTGSNNTATGAAALLFNTDGENNTAVGTAALLNNTASNNTAYGYQALSANAAGEENTATGAGALSSNTTGSSNTANGFQALRNNTTGFDNTAIGYNALLFNTGSHNTATGVAALAVNTGNFNTAIGADALIGNTTGESNTALGNDAGSNQTTGSGNVYIGAEVSGVAGENGACYIASIFNQTSVGGTPVFVNSSHKLGTSTSSKRFKEEIKPMDKASEVLFGLNPVTFRYKKEIDPLGVSQFGLVAEEVETVDSDLVVRDKEGKAYSVRYDQVNAMLLNEFLKEHWKVEELKKNFESKLTEQQKQIAALTSTLEKVSAQLELTKPALQPVAVNAP